jgi:hypothetical protein
MIQDFTSADIVRVINELAEAKPDFIYVDPDGVGGGENANCSYFHGDTPGCIVGHALARFGVGPGVAQEGSSAREVVDYLAASSDTEDLDYMTYVQQRQDEGVSWGEAVRLAQAEYPRGD